MKMRVEYEELWQPWYLGDEARESNDEYEIPEELRDRFNIAKQEMESVWEALRAIEHAAE